MITNQLLTSFLELYTLSNNIGKWSKDNFTNNPPRLYRLQAIEALMKALQINCSYQEFQYGEFLSGQNQLVQSELITKIKKSYPILFQTINTEEKKQIDGQFMFEILFSYRMQLQKLTSVKDSVLEYSENILRKKYLSTSEFKEQYHDFRLETHKENALSNYGTYATINTNGQIINQEAFNHTTESNTTESNTTENHDVNYWLKKITLNGDNVTFIPDELYCNNQFIKQAIQLNPESFYYLSQFYADDDEVGSFAFKTDPKSSYPYLSERLKASYKNQFEMHQSDEIDFDNMNSPLSQQEGDPDLPF